MAGEEATYMTERAVKLGIPEKDLKKALLLLRNLRIQALNEDLDPRAIRIALLFTEKCDREWAAEKLHPVAIAAMDSIAEELYQLARQRT